MFYIRLLTRRILMKMTFSDDSERAIVHLLKVCSKWNEISDRICWRSFKESIGYDFASRIQKMFSDVFLRFFWGLFLSVGLHLPHHFPHSVRISRRSSLKVILLFRWISLFLCWLLDFGRFPLPHPLFSFALLKKRYEKNLKRNKLTEMIPHRTSDCCAFC